MKVLLLGADGQLGWELQRSCPPLAFLSARDIPEVDFSNPTSIIKCIQKADPEVIINAAAYTAVDKAEQEEKLAHRINHDSVKEIAEICSQKNIDLVHISTDFVFDGQNYKPYRPDNKTNPISVYGKSKLDGEKAVLDIHGGKSTIIRTAWLYSSHGANFVKSMLNLLNTKPELNIIDEQIGTPTWANGLARAVWGAVQKKITGVHHFTDAGVASWYDFTVAIQEEALNAGLINKEIPINPIPASKYPTPAKRPFYSVLDKTSLWDALEIRPIHWRKQLRSMLKELS